MHISAHLDLDVLAHETDDQLSVLVELTAPAQPVNADRAPSTLVVVLDRSGSMAGPRLEQAKAALTALVDQLDPHDRFGLVTFDQHPTVVRHARPDRLASIRTGAYRLGSGERPRVLFQPFDAEQLGDDRVGVVRFRVGIASPTPRWLGEGTARRRRQLQCHWDPTLSDQS